MPDNIRRKRRRKPTERRSKCRIQSGGMNIQTCRHTMTEKWTKRKTERKMRSQNSRTQNNGKGRNNEIRDIERRRRANGGGAHRTTRAETGGREKREREGEKRAREGKKGNRRNTGENRTHRKRKTENPPLYKKEEAVFASSFLFIATMSRL